jgi:GTP diphosphokinase / guanosine-3',5'-bis(diphosphate) 3'-diphosphatase
VLPDARRAARTLQAGAGQVQGLHRDPEGQRLPVAAHDADRPVRHAGRVPDPDHVAESGVAAHWLYKDDDSDLSELQSRTHQWLQSLLEIQRQTGDSSEFLEHIKVDLFPDKVYVFTPKGKIVSLPRGATVVDFAYNIHTDVGNKCVAARINSEIQPLRTPLRNGDMVEIVTGPVARPNPAWLSFVRTGKARSEIRHFLRTMKFDESVELGERLLAQAARQFNLSLAEVTEAQWETVLRQAELGSRNDLLADIGLGRRLAAVVARQLALGAAPESPDEDSSTPRAATASPHSPVLIRGTEGMAVQLASCCHPIPGDAIVGHIRKGQGLAVHQAECVHAQRARRADPERWIELQWANDSTANFTVGLDVGVLNERGVLGRIAVAIAEGDSNILNVHVEDEEAQVALIHFKIQVRDRTHLARVIRSLRRVKHVVQIARPRGGTRGHQDAS